MEEEDVIRLFRESGALLDGHFQLSSGLHSSGYLQCALVLQHPARAELLAKALAEKIQSLGASTVISPALGGVIIGYEVARISGLRSLFAERQKGKLTLRRGFRLSPGEPVVVVEDVVTTGGSTLETIGVVREAGANVVGAISIIARGEVDPAFDVPFDALARVALPVYESDKCPQCVDKIPILMPGSRPSGRPV